jgi:hypothetical protein
VLPSGVADKKPMGFLEVPIFSDSDDESMPVVHSPGIDSAERIPTGKPEITMNCSGTIDLRVKPIVDKIVKMMKELGRYSTQGRIEDMLKALNDENEKDGIEERAVWSLSGNIQVCDYRERETFATIEPR